MYTIVLALLGAAVGWFAAQRGLVKMAPPTAAIAGGVGAIIGGVVLQLAFTVIGLVVGAVVGAAAALVLAQVAFRR